MPIYWLGLIMIMFFSMQLKLFPTGGRINLRLFFEPITIIMCWMTSSARFAQSFADARIPINFFIRSLGCSSSRLGLLNAFATGFIGLCDLIVPAYLAQNLLLLCADA